MSRNNEHKPSVTKTPRTRGRRANPGTKTLITFATIGNPVNKRHALKASKATMKLRWNETSQLNTGANRGIDFLKPQLSHNKERKIILFIVAH